MLWGRVAAQAEMKEVLETVSTGGKQTNIAAMKAMLKELASRREGYAECVAKASTWKKKHSSSSTVTITYGASTHITAHPYM